MNLFNKIPECLFDNILQYSDIKDIINLKNTNKENKKIIKNHTENKLSKITNNLKVIDCCNIENWIKLKKSDYLLKNAKQYYFIFKNLILNYHYFQEIFMNLYSLIENDIKNINNIKRDNYKSYEYIILTLFILFKNNSFYFLSNYVKDTDYGIYDIKEKMLNILFLIYSNKRKILESENFLKMEAILINTIQDLMNQISEMYGRDDKYSTFLIDYLGLWFVNTHEEYANNGENNGEDDTLFIYKNIKYIREIFKDFVDEILEDSNIYTI